MQKNKKYKILVIGSGNIANRIKSFSNNKKISVKVISFREITKAPRSENIKIIDNGYDLIVYSAYDHFNMLKNIGYLLKLINLLNKVKYDGILCFLNTQASILKDITRNHTELYIHLIFQRYSITKQIQSMLLKKSNFKYIDLHLPVVVGLNDKRAFFFKRLSRSNGLALPNKGNNKFYILDINSLCSFFFNIESALESNNNSKNRYLLFTKYLSIKEYLQNISGAELNFLETPNSNIYNLQTRKVFPLVTRLSVKNIVSTLLYIFKKPRATANISCPMTTDNIDPVKTLSPEQNARFWYNYHSPESIKNKHTICPLKV